MTEQSIRILFEMHEVLMNVSEEANQFYSTNTIPYVTVSFCYALFGIVFETKALSHSPNNTTIIVMATSYILWAIQYIAIIIILLHTCELTRESAFDTSTIVHKILQKKPTFLLHSDIYFNRMKSFSLHLLHHKQTFNFSGQGLFVFDYTFVFSVSVRLKIAHTKKKNHLLLVILCFVCFVCRRSAQEHHI